RSRPLTRSAAVTSPARRSVSAFRPICFQPTFQRGPGNCRRTTMVRSSCIPSSTPACCSPRLGGRRAVASSWRASRLSGPPWRTHTCGSRTEPVRETAMAAEVARRSRPSPLLALGQVRYQLLLLLRSPLGFFITLVIPLLLLISLNAITPPTAAKVPGGLRYAQFLTPAISAFCLLNACYVTTVTSMVLAREQGILQRLRALPCQPGLISAAGPAL